MLQLMGFQTYYNVKVDHAKCWNICWGAMKLSHFVHFSKENKLLYDLDLDDLVDILD